METAKRQDETQVELANLIISQYLSSLIMIKTKKYFLEDNSVSADTISSHKDNNIIS
jgi:hypothetical protein